MTMLRAIVLALLCAAVVTPSAHAVGPGPLVPPESSGSEYSENIPTNRGDVAAGLGTPTVRAVPPDVLAAIARAGADTESLTKIVTWSTYGAPEVWRERPVGPREVRTPGVVSAVGTALTTAPGALVLAMLAAFAAAVALGRFGVPFAKTR